MQIIFLLIIAIFTSIALFCSIKNGMSMLYFFLFMVMFQNVTGIIFCESIPSTYYTIFSVIKEMMLYMALACGMMARKKIVISRKKSVTMITLLIYGIILIKNLLATPAGMKSSALALRYMLVPILCIYVGKNLKISSFQTKKILKLMVGFSLVLAIFGLIDMFLLGDSFWTKIGYSTFAVKMKGNMDYHLYNGVTVNFYTWDFWGIPIRRLVSITADPLASAYLIYMGALIIMTGSISFFRKTRTTNVYFLVLGVLLVCSVLSLAKAVYVLIAVTFFVCAYFFQWLPKAFLKLAIVIVTLFTIVVLNLYVNNVTITTSVLNHVSGLRNGFAASNILGNGLGTAGASVMMLTNAEGSVAESFIGSMVYQIGILGVATFGVFIYEQIRNLIFLYKKYRCKLTVLALVSAFGITVCMIFSDSAVSIMGTGIYFMLIGIAQQEKVYLREENT